MPALRDGSADAGVDVGWGLLDLREAPRPTSRLVLAGLGALAVLFLAAGMVNLLLFPPLAPWDETAHVSYGYYVAEFDPPTIEDPLAGGPYDYGERYDEDRTLYVANHPPLFYALTGPALRAGNALTDGQTAIRLVRLIPLAFGLGALVAMVGLVSELVPSRPSVWLATAALAMLIPEVTHLSAFIYNDSAALALSLAVLWVGVRVFNRGVTTRRVVALTVVGALAALTRVAAVPFVLVAVGLVAVSVLRFSSGAARRRALGQVGLSVGVMGLLASPFYLRNLRLYGDVSGGSALYELFDRRRRDLADLVQPEYLAERYRGLWTGRDVGSGKFPIAWLETAAFALLWVGLALGLIALVRWGIRQWRLGRGRGLFLAAAVGLIAASVLVGFALHVTRGGNPHTRYLMGGIWVVGLLIAIGLAMLPRALATATLGAGVTLLMIGTVLVNDEVLKVAAGREPESVRFFDLPLAGSGPSAVDRWRGVAEYLGPLPSVALAFTLILVPAAIAVYLRCDFRLRAGSDHDDGAAQPAMS